MWSMHLFIVFMATNAKANLKGLFANRFASKANISTDNVEYDLEKGLWYDVENQEDVNSRDSENNDDDSFFDAEEEIFEKHGNEEFEDTKENFFEEYEKEEFKK